MVDPVNTLAFIMTVWPKLWNKGSVAIVVSLYSNLIKYCDDIALVCMLVCESSAPFG